MHIGISTSTHALKADIYISEKITTVSDRKELRFQFDWKDYWVDAEDAEKSSRDIMHMSAGRVMNLLNCFNDLSLYRWLKFSKGCLKVELIRVHVHHSELFVFGLQSIYRVTYFNGKSREIAAAKHVCASDTHTNGHVPKASTLKLKEDEFISRCVTRQGEIVDRITFVTNFRRVSFGGNGGIAQEETEQFDGVVSRVVAFAGTKGRALERIGYFVEPVNWDAIRNVAVLRNLLESGRAETSNSLRKGWTKEQAVVNTVLTRADDDIFRRILFYLISEKPNNVRTGTIAR